MSVIKKAIPIEKIEKEGLDLSLFRRKGNSKTYKGYLIQKMKEARQEKNFDVALIIQHFYKKLLEFETFDKIQIESWRGKGKIKVFNQPDKIIVEFAGRRDKDQKPNIQRREYSKSEINKMIRCINKLKEDYNNKIPSRMLGECYFEGNWDISVFSNRSEHTKFTHLLNILDYYKLIKYSRAGYTSIIKPIREIQEVLK